MCHCTRSRSRSRYEGKSGTGTGTGKKSGLGGGMTLQKLFLAAVLWLTALAISSPLPAQGTAATSITNAVVRIPSHGASATVIYTDRGKTLLLGCGHAYQGGERFKH